MKMEVERTEIYRRSKPAFLALNILVNASTLDECVDDFQEEFFVLYEAYAKEADEKLTGGAKRLKRILLDMTEI
jgi:hypothetical protein